MEDAESLDQVSPEDTKFNLGLLDELNIKPSETGNLPLESLFDLGESPGCMDNPFFEQYMDLDQLFPELPLLDNLNLGFGVEQTLPVSTSDICQSDVVTAETGGTGEYVEVASTGSEIIDVVSLVSDSELSSSMGDLTDIALSPESVVDVVSVEENVSSLPSSAHQLAHDSNQAEMATATAAEEITVIETSDALTLLTQKLLQSLDTTELKVVPSSDGTVDSNSENMSTVTVDIDELFSFSDDFGHVDNVVLPSVGDVCTFSQESSVKAQSEQKRKRGCSSDSCKSPAKKVRCESVDKESEYNEVMSNAGNLDKQTVRRLKNNIASKHARASRRQKEQDLFQQEEELEKSNAELRKQVQELENLTTMLRKVLVEKLSGVTCPL